MSNVIENRISDSYANRKRERKRKNGIDRKSREQTNVCSPVGFSVYIFSCSPTTKATMYVFYVTQKLTRGRVERKKTNAASMKGAVSFGA